LNGAAGNGECQQADRQVFFHRTLPLKRYYRLFFAVTYWRNHTPGVLKRHGYFGVTGDNN
jgi:hypothetical protein